MSTTSVSRPTSAGSRAQPGLPRVAAIAGPARSAAMPRPATRRPGGHRGRERRRCSMAWRAFRAPCFDLRARRAGARRRAEPGPRRRLRRSGARSVPLDLIGGAHTSRQSAYQARLLFCLAAAKVERLSAAPLADLQRARVHARRAGLRVSRAAVVLARSVHGHASRAAPATHADGVAARYRALAGRSAGRRKQAPDCVCRAARRGPYNSRPRSAGGS